jgi:PAS domain S-box-containing protein
MKIKRQRKQAEDALQVAHEEIERCIEERTAELTRTNDELNREIAECKKAEEALKASEKKYSTLIKNSPDIIYILDAKGNFRFAAGAIKSLLGFTAEELEGNHFSSIIYPEDVNKAEWRFNERRTGRRATKKFEVRLSTKEGKEKHFDIRYLNVELHAFGIYDKPISAKDKKFLGTYGVARDITERKQAEEQIKASLKEKELLLKEIHHRVRNNMQVISSLLKLQSHHIKDKEALAMFRESQARIRAMALIHEKLYRSEDFARIDFARYVRSLARQVFAAYSPTSSAIQLTVHIKDLFLDITTAIPCGLILNELVSNSLKHGFPEGGEGEIIISMHPFNNNELALVVSDTGIGFPEDIDFRATETLGMQLVATLVGQLEGTIELNRGEGTTFTITFRHPESKEGRQQNGNGTDTGG